MAYWGTSCSRPTHASLPRFLVVPSEPQAVQYSPERRPYITGRAQFADGGAAINCHRTSCRGPLIVSCGQAPARAGASRLTVGEMLIIAQLLLMPRAPDSPMAITISFHIGMFPRSISSCLERACVTPGGLGIQTHDANNSA